AEVGPVRAQPPLGPQAEPARPPPLLRLRRLLRPREARRLGRPLPRPAAPPAAAPLPLGVVLADGPSQSGAQFLGLPAHSGRLDQSRAPDYEAVVEDLHPRLVQPLRRPAAALAPGGQPRLARLPREEEARLQRVQAGLAEP